jgi:hypothetical protein
MRVMNVPVPVKGSRYGHSHPRVNARTPIQGQRPPCERYIPHLYGGVHDSELFHDEGESGTENLVI